ncbi:alpha/beta hydrolase [Hydrogenophaga crassostreae]|uniref:Alpha/beta hydrolase n=1 Tax=Hydrogenophaga crassostreae TaxID=1763535 RepID=A0A163CPU3_9BURK|nr:alpha/beta fold hydrolase [Hydrogenophaga crassostreae]AOW13913.1 alpha/beta hydrolase [Hydrogenophaga crassostreae]OAD44121.1 alpha/beta hydrolase [Hydrogenophaga crassostreae]
MKRLLLLAIATAALAAGCASLDERQRGWIFQPSDRSWWRGEEAAAGMSDRWVDFTSRETGQPVRLHGLWLANDRLARDSKAPVMLYLHGARFNVTGSAFRARRMQELGFSVLSVDYRGFGKSSSELPSETMAVEDARAAWDWLGREYPGRPRYIFGHSLGGAIAIELAAQVEDEAGTLVEGSFTSIPDVVSSYKWGWLPVGPLITQRFEAVKRVADIGSPLLVVHGSEDRTIAPELGKRLFDAAKGQKRFELVEGGSHHNTNAVGQPQYRVAMAELFGLR